MVETITLKDDILPKHSVSLEIKCQTPNKIENYEVKFVVFHEQTQITSQCSTILIKTGFEDDLTYEEFFFEFDEILKLSKDKQKTIYDIIINDLSCKTPMEIVKILEKNKWKVEKAIEQLTSE